LKSLIKRTGQERIRGRGKFLENPTREIIKTTTRTIY